MAILTQPSDAEFGSFFEIYGLGAHPSIRGIEGGTVNSSFETSINGTTYFLRIYEEQGFEGAKEEAELLLRLVARGVRTPKPIRTRDGAYIGQIAGKPAALFEWSQGRMRCQKSVTAHDTFQLGAALARFHLASANERPKQGRFDVDSLLQRIGRIRATDPSIADRLQHGLTRFAEMRRPLPTGLTHGDLFRDNVLWQGGELAALIDFESVSTGPLAYDVMVTLLAWCFGDQLDLSLSRALLRGYRSVRPLSVDEQNGLFVEGAIACHRFTITRITDNTIRIGKDYRRFLARLDALERLGVDGVRSLCESDDERKESDQ